MIHLILGGARSGKSGYAERQLADLCPANVRPWYLATAESADEEMARRIAHHQTARQGGSLEWQLAEVPLDLAKTLVPRSGSGAPVLVDCLTLWLSNQLCLGADMACERAALLQAVAEFDGDLLLVSNEVGSGIVPLGELSRRFVDEAGWLNQALAAKADRVTLVVAGLPLALKPVNSDSSGSLGFSASGTSPDQRGKV